MMPRWLLLLKSVRVILLRENVLTVLIYKPFKKRTPLPSGSWEPEALALEAVHWPFWSLFCLSVMCLLPGIISPLKEL